MVASKQQDTFYTNDNLINVSMRPSSADLQVDNTTLSTSNTCVNNVSISGTDTSAGIQFPAEHEGSFTDRSLSTGSDQNSSLFTTQVSDNSCSTDSDQSDGSASYQSNSQYILDLGLKCKGFRMGHINIQGLSNKIDQVRLLLESDKNEIHVLGLKANTEAHHDGF